MQCCRSYSIKKRLDKGKTDNSCFEVFFFIHQCISLAAFENKRKQTAQLIPYHQESQTSSHFQIFS